MCALGRGVGPLHRIEIRIEATELSRLGNSIMDEGSPPCRRWLGGEGRV